MAGNGGKRQGAGRPKGVPNKTTQSVKDAITEAFERRGGVPSLVAWAEENQTEFYKLWGRLLPTDVKLEHSGSMTLEQLIVGEKPKP